MMSDRASAVCALLKSLGKLSDNSKSFIHSFYAMVLECVRSTNEGFLEYWLKSSSKVNR